MRARPAAAASPSGTTPPSARSIQQDTRPALHRHARRHQARRRGRAPPAGPRPTTSPAWASPWPTPSTPPRPAVAGPAAARRAAGRADRRALCARRAAAGGLRHRLRQRGRPAGRRQRGLGPAPSRHAGAARASPCRSATAWAWPCWAARDAGRRRRGRCATARPTRSSSSRTTSTAALDAAAVDALLAAAKHVIVIDHLPDRHDRAGPRSSCRPPPSPRPTARWSTTRAAPSGSSRSSRRRTTFRIAGAGWASWPSPPARADATRGPTWTPSSPPWPRDLPAFADVPAIAPPADFRMVGQKIPRQPHRYSGRTAMTANVDVHEPQPPDDPDSPLAFSMEGYDGQPPPALLPAFWAPGWNSVQALNKFQIEVGGPLRGGDPGRRLIEPASRGRPRAARRTVAERHRRARFAAARAGR